jgi:major membrane immunogen (membrane-anchored lipoprotein)
MKLHLMLAALALAAGCGKKDDKTAKNEATNEPAPAAEPAKTAEADKASTEGYVDVPNTDGLIAKVPANAKPTSAGFSSDDRKFGLVVKPVDASDAPDIAALKQKLPDVKEWTRESKTDDGWIVTFTVPMGEQLEYGMQMRRKIDGTDYKCSAMLSAPDGLGAVIEACQSLRKK